MIQLLMHFAYEVNLYNFQFSKMSAIETTKEIKDQDMLMDPSTLSSAHTRIGSTKTRITQFMRKSAFDPKYKSQYDQVHRVESRIRRDLIQQIKEKQKPLE